MSRVLLREILALNTATNTTAISPSSMINNINGHKTEVWKSPTPYLFGSLALMLLLIATALILLLLSYRRQYSSSRVLTSHGGDVVNKSSLEKPASDDQVVVIMAGDERPSQIATPVVFTIAMPTANVCSCGGGQHTVVKV